MNGTAAPIMGLKQDKQGRFVGYIESVEVAKAAKFDHFPDSRDGAVSPTSVPVKSDINRIRLSCLNHAAQPRKESPQ